MTRYWLQKCLGDVTSFDNNNFRNNSSDFGDDASSSILTTSVESIIMFANYVLREKCKAMDDFVYLFKLFF